MLPLRLSLLCCATTTISAQDVDYQRDVRPILSDRCYACHGPDPTDREAGLRLDVREYALAELDSGVHAIVPGDLANSALVDRITTDEPSDRMPPPESGKHLTDAERDVLARWIAQGAEFSKHWAFVTPARTDPPPVVHPGWSRNPIDDFVLAELERRGLTPAAEAEKSRLLRRVTLDLTGLPPTPEERAAFLADDAPNAYDRLVDRLLASPHYGEHRARYWLDAARYGDTHGFHLDNYRSIWPYRDWVIEAFNANQPFDEFTIEQLAGDLLPESTRAQRIATGFQRCNPTTAEGGLIEAEYLARYAADRVETTGTVWLGLTVGCARCHDHRFDPISQREFYELFAFFHSIDEEASDQNAAAPPPVERAPSPAQEAELVALERERAELAARMDAPMAGVDARQLEWEREQADRVIGAFTDLVPVSAFSRDGATLTIVDGSTILATGQTPPNDAYELTFETAATDVRAVRLEALAHDESPGGGVGRAEHDNIVLTDVRIEVAPADDPEAFEVVPIRTASADWTQRGFAVQNAIDDDAASGWAIDGGDDEDRVAVFAPERAFGFPQGSVVRVRLAFDSEYPQHTIGKLRIATSSAAFVAPLELGPWQVGEHLPAQDPAAARRLAPTDVTAWHERPELTDDRVHQLPGDIGTTFLRRTVDVPVDREIEFALGSDDGVRVFRGDECVFENDVPRSVAPDQDRVTVRLPAGRSELVLAIQNHGGEHAFFFRVVAEHVLGLPNTLAETLGITPEQRTTAQRDALRRYYRRRASPEWSTLDDTRRSLQRRIDDLERAIPRTLVMRERAEPRPAHVLIRGHYDQLGPRVEPGVPAVLPPLPSGVRADRLALARWLVDPDHPLTARVTVNRLWQSVFGRGIVETAEDFGSQGSWPTHPRLLDWLAREFVDTGWDVKHVMRLIVTSATYRQSSRSTPERYAEDPDNRWLGRGPRFRLDAEVIRDQALTVSGLLTDRLGGPSVKPYQPAGLWKAVAYTSSNTATFERDDGDALYRRSLYTFWKRTSPPPTLQTFDAPTRESCRVRRARTNTPLQALATLNDVQFVETARALATRVLLAHEHRDARIDALFQAVTMRAPSADEQGVLARALDGQIASFEGDADRAQALAAFGESPVDPSIDAIELAAWTTLASLVLNLDEVLTKG
ncbi:MAG: PSD1 domain-containing protein [Planctomycetes bacterium]|nr:PSD1 domain-containing protein [Planctomycetota bacterium]